MQFLNNNNLELCETHPTQTNSQSKQTEEMSTWTLIFNAVLLQLIPIQANCSSVALTQKTVW